MNISYRLIELVVETPLGSEFVDEIIEWLVWDKALRGWQFVKTFMTQNLEKDCFKTFLVADSTTKGLRLINLVDCLGAVALCHYCKEHVRMSIE